mgnify:CR=1 FL=1
MTKAEIYGRAAALLLGYLPGCILTGAIVAKVFTGKSASEIGRSGNPGMANIMANVGFKAGILTLAGDLVKCIAAALLGHLLLRSRIGGAAVLYAVTGCILGHDFPFWRRFHGGKGVASGCIGFVLIEPLAGAAAVILGMLTVFATQYLCVGACVIPAAFALLLAWQKQWEAAAVALFLAAVSVIKNPDIWLIRRGECPKTDVPGALRKKFKKK